MQPDGKQISVTDRVGRSVMDFAVDHGVIGIASQCGGACICTKCHCYIDANWLQAAGKIAYDEEEMLEFVPGRRDSSRLACQVIVTPDLDGLTVHVETETGSSI